MTASYTIALVPFDGSGHVNPCLGLAETLSQMGHHCVLVVNQHWPQVVAKHGFEYRVYEEENKNDTNHTFWNDFMAKFGHSFKLSAFDKIRAFEAECWPPIIRDIRLSHQKMLDIFLDVKPDVIVLDSFVDFPAVQCAGVPWVELLSGNPLSYWHDQRLPPGGSGLPTDGDKHLWSAFVKELADATGQIWDEFNDWIRSVAAPPLQHRGKFVEPSPYLNLSVCPEELNYDDIAPMDPKRFFSVDNFMRDQAEGSEKFAIPEQLRDKPGKLVYLSMGTLACSELTLMRRLVSILSKSKHRFIVSKGPKGDEYGLADNMWGQNSVPQLQVLETVDAVITHGGNNTVVECLAAGTPMIVMPIFSDQFDNAQRVHEKGLGLRLDAYLSSEAELLAAVDSIVNDSELKAKYSVISSRIRRDNTKQRGAQMIIDLIEQNKSDLDSI